MTRVLAAFAAAFILASCSSDKGSKSFSLDGVEAPPPEATACNRRPDGFGEANFLGTEGSGICTVRDAWNVRAVSGVAFSQPATANCAVINSFRDWIDNAVQPAAEAAYGSRVSQVQIAATFACRPRNGRRGAKLSEHGFGNAIDVSGFTFANGRTLSVEDDYYRSDFLQLVRKRACGRFKTVLGPGSDSSHKDHFHFDLANRKSGSNYCH
jgi:hypothetical protein